MSGYKPRERAYHVTWTNATYWHRSHPGPSCAFCRVRTEGMAHLVAPLERAGFKVLHVDTAFVSIDMRDEPFKRKHYGFTTREALRLRRVIEQPALTDA